jgi:hypothetical protein
LLKLRDARMSDADARVHFRRAIVELTDARARHTRAVLGLISAGLGLTPSFL